MRSLVGCSPEHGAAPDWLQRPLQRRSRFRQQVSPIARASMERSRSASGRYEERAMWCSTGWCIVTLTLGILAAPLAAGAQQAKVARVGYLTFSPITPGQAPMEAFRQGLRALGWVEGQNLVIETRSGE